MSEVAELQKNRSTSLTHLRRKTVVGVLKAWREVKGTAKNVIGADPEPSLSKTDAERLREQMRECLDPKGGEITARAYTAELGRTYLMLNQTGRGRFLKILAEEFDTDPAVMEKAIAAYQKATTPADKAKAEAQIRSALVTPRSIILRQFTALESGFKFLVDMRADMTTLGSKDPKLKALEGDLKEILASWFDIGLLDLVQITWNSPAALLEKLIEYEAVHAIRSWDDLKNRLDSDRRVYAFFHNKMPLEPLIFVQVAFVDGMSDSIQSVLDTEAPPLDIDKADTAIFYSISNAQKGLAGISFGNFLIKRVVNEISSQYKNIKTFATLSPVPGFRNWLDPQLAKGATDIFLPNELRDLKTLTEVKTADNAAKALLKLLDGDWYKDSDTVDALEPVLMRLCAHYLTNEKKGGRPLDPVAGFHLFNGARLERMNWLGDTSPKGMKQSAGIMVNYFYKLSEIDENHEEFVSDGKIVASRQVRGYL